MSALVDGILALVRVRKREGIEPEIGPRDEVALRALRFSLDGVERKQVDALLADQDARRAQAASRARRREAQKEALRRWANHCSG